MCNLYSMTSSQAAIIDLLKVWQDKTGNMPALPGIYPNNLAPVVTNTPDGRVLSMMRWGMPTPPQYLRGKNYDKGVTNVRNTKSPHWRRWLVPEHRCVVPFTAFSEFQRGHGNRWFATEKTQPLAVFAGIWTPWTSVRKVKDGETSDELFAFLTTDPNAVVAPFHPKAMPVILTTPEEVDAWLSAPVPEAMALQRPLADDQLVLIEGPE
ncbi:SOS response-associated peptidase [Yoonia sp. R2-816]|uniref:SOS response-associated peptidase n=1 Tax=Yoonia sp. R2-816 TaxID=3342638 RepID=UPI0037286A77